MPADAHWEIRIVGADRSTGPAIKLHDDRLRSPSGVVFGREPQGADIPIRVTTVSNPHFKVREIGAGRLSVEDLGSKNGTYISDNGRWKNIPAHQPIEIEHGARIGLPASSSRMDIYVEITFVSLRTRGWQPPLLNPRPLNPKPKPLPEVPQPPRPGPDAMKATWEIKHSLRNGQTIARGFTGEVVKDKRDGIILGRDQGVDCFFDIPGLMPRAIRIFVQAGGIYIALTEENKAPTLLNGQPLRHGGGVSLRDKSKLMIADLEFTFSEFHQKQ